MKKFLEKAPLLVAILVALCVAILARFLVPIVLPKPEKELMELQVPDIKLIANADMQSEEYVEVAVVGIDMPMNTILSTDHISWSKWPKATLAATYIVREDGRITANADAYSKAVGQYASHHIPAGVPLLPDMFGERIVTQEEMRAQFEEEKKELEREQKQNKQDENFNIKPGMRAVTVPISKQSANSAVIMRIGDVVDVMYMKRQGGYTAQRSVECVQYNAVRILAIDGQCKNEEQGEDMQRQSRSQGGGMFGSADKKVPTNVTLELTSHQVREMMPHVQNEGIVIILRPYSDSEEGEFSAESDATEDDSSSKAGSVVDQSISSESVLDMMKVMKSQSEAQKSLDHQWSAFQDMMQMMRCSSFARSGEHPQVLGYVRENSEGSDDAQSISSNVDMRGGGGMQYRDSSMKYKADTANMIFCARGTDSAALSFDKNGRLLESTSISTGGSGGSSR